MLFEKIQSIKPHKVLDIGCGGGEFTREISPYCSHITAIDSSQKLIERSKRDNAAPNIKYICLDARNTGFPDKSFDCIVDRASLHHMQNWEKTLDEMFRLSSKYVLVSEPLDDSRSEEKRNLNEAQNLYLEVQHEAGYEHYNHLKKDVLKAYFDSGNIKYECIVEKYDDIIEFDEYFSLFDHFAERTSRKEYWKARLNDFTNKLNGGKLCANDVINFFCEV